MEAILLALNSNKILWGIAFLITNVGSRHIIQDMIVQHSNLFSDNIIRILVVVCMFFVGSRDIYLTIFLTATFFIVFNGLLDKSKKFNLLPSYLKGGNSNLSHADYVKAKDYVFLYEAIKTKDKQNVVMDVYKSNKEKIKYVDISK